MSVTILVVEDDPKARRFLSQMLRDASYEVREAGTLAEAHASLDRGEGDIILLDIQLPDGYGLSLLKRINLELPGLPVIVITGVGDVRTAVNAMKDGAVDFIEKPIDMKEVLPAVAKAAENVSMRRELDRLRSASAPSDDYVLGETPAMKRLAHDLARVAPSTATVLITGENGTGKEVIAGALHRMSPRGGRAWVAVSCANFSEALLESELFGYEAGAFTGATKRKEGLFVAANNGTLFLDEISTMKHDLQAKLLRVLEERAVRRVGGTNEVKVDVRIIAASNRNLPGMVAAGEFREDLYHRLNVVELHLPPLRERLDDLPALAGFFIRRFNAEMARSVRGLGPGVLEALKACPWPGNIRQLRNAIERAMVFCDDERLQLGHFSLDIAQPALTAA
jgi:DNA-binding NtrC family response regulator